MLLPETYKVIASHASFLASVASGDGDYALANSLWAFEARYKRLVEKAYAVQAERLRHGELRVRLDMVLLHALRKRHLITRDEFECYRTIVETMDVS